MRKLTAVVGVKNEAPYIPQWIEFHLLQGFDHFLIYDNGSSDGLTECLKPYTDAGIVSLKPVPVEYQNNGAGVWLIVDAINWGQDNSAWMIVTGVDEYCFCPQGQMIPDFLREFEIHGALAVSWKMFNSSGHESASPKLVIERFTDAYRETTPHVKSFIQPRMIQQVCNPHFFLCHTPWETVNENHERVTSAHPPGLVAKYDRIRINHYWTMSRAEFNEKMNKGRSDQPGQDGKRREGADDLWNHAHHPNEQIGRDDSLLKFADAVKENLRKRFAS